MANIEKFIDTLELRENAASATQRDLEDQIKWLRDRKATLDVAAAANKRELEMIQAVLADARRLLRN